MGKKINPKVFRMNITTTHLSKWFMRKQQFPHFLQQDVMLRKYLKTRLKDSGVSRIEIRRSTGKIVIAIATSKPGMIIGRSGSGIDELKKQVKKNFFGSEKIQMNIEIEEVRRPELDSELVMQNIIYQLEKRVPFRRAMKRAVETVIGAGAKGVKITCSGRLNGVEIARRENLVEGSIPSHTLRADIDYARGAAQTIYGKIGVKVWIYKGHVYADQKKKQEEEERKKWSNTRRKTEKTDKDVTTKKSKFTKKRTIVKDASKKGKTVSE